MRFDQFNESSLDIFSISSLLLQFGRISPDKEDVNFKIMEILEQEGSFYGFSQQESIPGDTGRC